MRAITHFLQRPTLALALGVFAVFMLAILGGRLTGAPIAAALEEEAARAIAAVDGTPVKAEFASPNGLPSRHPRLTGGEDLAESKRAEIARAVAAVHGVGGPVWADGTMQAESSVPQVDPLHCQDDVQALLRARSLRFEEGSARIDEGSSALVAEVADALRPCLGAIIAITGHTDSSGPEPGNLALSRERADAVRQALIARGIPADGLRARGVGSREPVPDLPPQDPANRRIEFRVVATNPIVPTPVDTPGPR
ncbi:OmpA family protein [Paraurantiacibacter namhicola]|uniref:Peptidoglycan-binding protein ArfA n=1 Tax=Paraurantiacibacter namhicola TaxID=645517 RepID=A0A1C7D7U0_9SPHN|nr:OmpA family protein [Paraurantiacibacter namhicola]ANU07363.1 Peptidoglycan-binding protein ArfA [Paraurantiacibacter namhicola]